MAGSEKNHVAINIESVATSFENHMSENLIMSPNCCIFKTPKILYRHNKKAYEPNAFSIGPFHYGKDQLNPAQKIKLKYLQGLLSRSISQKEQLLRQLIAAIREVEGQARECYAGSIEFGVDEFVKILVLDGCFIVELLRKDFNEVPRDPDDPIFSMSCLLQFLYHDLILLENQIPWLVLDRLFSLTMVPGGKSLIQLTVEFFGNIFSSHLPSVHPVGFGNQEIRHILGLLRLSLLSPFEKEQSNAQHLGWQPFPFATSIKAAGIKFKRVSSSSILDIRFSNGVLEIPPLLIQETTETILRNLISYEQCYPNCQPRITSYAKLMDNLIDCTRDMDILCESDVIDNWLNPDDATQFFNRLYNDAYVKMFYYNELCSQVNDHCKRWWPRWRTFYMHNYFGTPWAVVSQVVAAIFLILSFLQTFYTIMGA
ncbi:hypothetical protein Dsin_031069 [Dipteronia sinensis]|uniref:Uncharacterized protein n=1 Tax=Dipteronia sinensis TaxID=43782 RepID=A0AAE0DRV3_9ROSI|nr:hypothetical protein Dsin_031069 [Dipteronia sinensis]